MPSPKGWPALLETFIFQALPSTKICGKLGKLYNGSAKQCHPALSDLKKELITSGSGWLLERYGPWHTSSSAFFMFSSSVKWHRRCCMSNKSFPLPVLKTILQNAWSHAKRFTINGFLTQGTLASVSALVWNHQQPWCITSGKGRSRTTSFSLYTCYFSPEKSGLVLFPFPFPRAIDSSCPG